MEEKPERTIGPYGLEELLGRGGMAEVYRARRQGPGGFEKVLALKRILPSYARDPQLVGRFLEEARICARLEHSNIVSVVDFGSAGGEYYLVMEWVDGASLFAVLKQLASRGERLPAEAAAYVIAEAALGLDEAHSLADEAGRPLGLVHRDVSPQNVLVSRKGEVKVGDFGIAKAVGSSVRTAAGVLIGKLCYMSPEQARNETLDARADVYALGVVLWECLVGRPLFPRGMSGEALNAVLEPRVPPPSEVSVSPRALDAIVTRAVAPSRSDRYADAGAFARDLRVWLHGVAPGFGPGDLAAFLAQSGTMQPPPAPQAAAAPTVTFDAGPAAAATVPARPPVAPRAAPSPPGAATAVEVRGAGPAAASPPAVAGAALAGEPHEVPTTRAQPSRGRGGRWTGCLIAAIILAVGAIGGFATCMSWLARMGEQQQPTEQAPPEDETATSPKSQ
ncbi:MAG: serine/threonine protein kinase [Deltaproteobacteria bacterium]|nr:serine/threonine protein kinase [Deltaproteobacteria bacterium]